MSGLLISINLVIEYFALQREEYWGFTLKVKKYAATLFFEGVTDTWYDTNNKKRRIRAFGTFIIVMYAAMEVSLLFFKSAGPLKRRGVAYISRSSFFNVISCQKSAREYGTRSRLFDSFSELTLFCLSPRVFCATLLNCIQAWNHLERLSFPSLSLFCLSVSFHTEMPPKKLGLIVCINIRHLVVLFHILVGHLMCVLR